MGEAIVKGWCPDAWHPMMSGDGLLIRVKPHMGRVSLDQLKGLCDASEVFGNGLIDITRRANFQIRGVSDRDVVPLLHKLVALDLVVQDRDIETRRNVIVSPDWETGDDTHRIACELHSRWSEFPVLPGKFGFLIDAGDCRNLSQVNCDVRIERGANGGLIIRVDGQELGTPLEVGEEVTALTSLAHWFIETGGIVSGRLGRHIAPLPAWASPTVAPAAVAPPLCAGLHRLGALYAVPFGQVKAATLSSLGSKTQLTGLRVTPLSMVLAENGSGDPVDGLIVDPQHPLATVLACAGSPACSQATVETHPFAMALAPYVNGKLHVSGCSKLCAGTDGVDVLLTGRDGTFDLLQKTSGGQKIAFTALSPSDLLTYFGAA